MTILWETIWRFCKSSFGSSHSSSLFPLPLRRVPRHHRPPHPLHHGQHQRRRSYQPPPMQLRSPFVPPPLTSNQVDQKDPPAPTRGNAAAVPAATRSPATVVTVSEYAHVKGPSKNYVTH